MKFFIDQLFSAKYRRVSFRVYGLGLGHGLEHSILARVFGLGVSV